MKIRSDLRACLGNLSIAEAAKKAGLTEAQLRKLCQKDGYGPKWGVELLTMEKILNGLGLPPERWLVVEDPDFRNLISQAGGSTTITVGTHHVALVPSNNVLPSGLPPAAVRREAIEVWDARALVEILKKCPGSPCIVQSACTLSQSENDVVNDPTIGGLWQSKGVLLSLGSALCSGTADFLLLEILSQRWTLPFQYWWSFIGQDYRRYHSYGHTPQGIAWMEKNKTRLRIEVPEWKTIRNYSSGTPYDDAAIIVLQPTPKRRSWWLLAMGFMGPGSMAAAAFLWTDAFARIVAAYRQEITCKRHEREGIAQPLSVLLKVPCEKTGPRGSYEVKPGAAEPITWDPPIEPPYSTEKLSSTS